MSATKWAFRLAVAIAILCLLLCLTMPVGGLLGAIVYAAFAWGLKKRQRWAAVAWLASVLLPIPFAMSQFGAISAGQLVVFLAMQLGVAIVVLLAAIELWRDETSSNSCGIWVAAIVGMLAFLVCFHPYFLPTDSMRPTILQGDYFLMETVTPRLHRLPERGDLIVFRSPVDPKEIFVKRVAGIPGDRLHIVNKQLYRNGAAVSEPYVVHATSYVDSYRDNFPSEPNAPLTGRGGEMLRNNVRNGEVVVPPGQYFVMGDNRDDSLDSRYFGFVPRNDIVGRPWVIYASYAVQGESAPRTAFNTRWNRLFKVL